MRAEAAYVALALMSYLTYTTQDPIEQQGALVWLHDEAKTPPFSAEARLEAGGLLRRLERGQKLGMPQSRPMAAIGA